MIVQHHVPAAATHQHNPSIVRCSGAAPHPPTQHSRTTARCSATGGPAPRAAAASLLHAQRSTRRADVRQAKVCAPPVPSTSQGKGGRAGGGGVLDGFSKDQPKDSKYSKDHPASHPAGPCVRTKVHRVAVAVQQCPPHAQAAAAATAAAWPAGCRHKRCHYCFFFGGDLVHLCPRHALGPAAVCVGFDSGGGGGRLGKRQEQAAAAAPSVTETAASCVVLPATGTLGCRAGHSTAQQPRRTFALAKRRFRARRRRAAPACRWQAARQARKGSGSRAALPC